MVVQLLSLEPKQQGRVEDTPLTLLLEAPGLGDSWLSVLAFIIQFGDTQLLCMSQREAVDTTVTAVLEHFR